MNRNRKDDFARIDIAKIKGLLVDLDNTIYAYEPCHKAGLLSAYRYYKKHVESVSYEVFIHLYKQAQQKVKKRIPTHAASHSRLLYFQNMLEVKHVSQFVLHTSKLEELYWKAFSSRMVHNAPLMSFLKQCKKKGLHICLITDLTATLQFSKIRKLGLEKLVDCVVTSEEAGADKPNKKVFFLALEKLGLKAQDVIMIGDDIKKDIEGATRCGIKAYVVSN